MNTKKTRRVLCVFFVFFVDKLIDEFSPLQFAVAAEVDKEASFHASGLEIIQDLRFFFAGESIHCFQLDNDLSIANDVGDVFFLQPPPFIGDDKWFLAFERYAAAAQLYLKRLLINRFEEARSKLAMNFYRSANNSVTFLAQDQFFSFVSLRVLCGDHFHPPIHDIVRKGCTNSGSLM